MRSLRTLLVVATAILSRGCALVVSNLPFAGSADDCSQCPDCTCLDLYLPDGTAAPVPLVFFMHGGLWCSGSKTEITEVCTAVVALSQNTVACAAADYHPSQSLGGGCSTGAKPTYAMQASELVEAVQFLGARPEINPDQIILGGHSSGAHLAAWLSLRWDSVSPSSSSVRPAGYFGVEGIYNATMWETYDVDFWSDRYRCATWQAFGDPLGDGWTDGSPSTQALLFPPVAPVFLMHSPGDTWVQTEQTLELFGNLQGGGFKKLDVDGNCVQGQHPNVLLNNSALTLARCLLDFSQDVAVTRDVLQIIA